jgi:hypothetical protein
MSGGRGQGVRGPRRTVDPTSLLEKRIAALAYLGRAVSAEGVFLWNAVHVDPGLIVRHTPIAELARMYVSLGGGRLRSARSPDIVPRVPLCFCHPADQTI